MQNVFLIVAVICAANAQNGRLLPPPSYNNGHGWDIRLAVPGEPGNDYPTLAAIPRTSFSCADKEPGYYADTDTNCQVFRVCTVGATYGFQSFLCPNGTLFNQAVFVCDWWMNVNCKKSDQVLNNKNDQFENLKLGPQLMKDIKKMLTHPVRNPFNTNTIRSKLLVMQSYKPPSGQLFPNGALLATPERAPSHIYIPTKAIQIALRQNEFIAPSRSFAASTYNPQYIPPTLSTFTPTSIRNVEILQRQILNGQNIRDNSSPKTETTDQTISNGHAGQVPLQSRHSHVTGNFINRQAPHQLRSYNNYENLQRTLEKNQKNIQTGQYFGYTEEKLSNKDKNSNTLKTRRPPVISNPTQKGQKTKNLVSSDVIPPTALTKTVAYSRLIQEPREGSPKSRITFKTWVLKPAKNAKLITNPTPYTYDVPTNSIGEKLEFDGPYSYNKPVVSVTLERTSEAEINGYNYNKPTEPTIEFSPTKVDISSLYLSPTTLPTFTENVLTTSLPTQASRLYLVPETFKSAERQYLPPTESSSTVSNQYLIPNSSLRKLSRYQNAQLFTSPTATTTEYTISDMVNDINSIHLSPQYNIDSNDHNKLSFDDILSKENLDITINEIVNDTNINLQSSTLGNINQNFNSNILNSLSSVYNPEDREELTEPPRTFPKPAKLIAVPSSELEAPTETFNEYQNKNNFSSLPFLKEKVLPTIERTVSLKITIPESIANFLFKTRKDADLEVLNTGSSNYLVFRNTQNKNTDAKFSPIGKLTWNENSNLSTSQALVFSLLADSINTAKKYNNIVQENVVSPTTSTRQFQAVNNEELGRISNTISQLTASQFTDNNFKTRIYNNANIASQQKTALIQKNLTSPKHALQKIATITQGDNLNSKQVRKPLNDFISDSPGNINSPIYSGQLYKYPVPEVTRQIINSPNPANSNIILQSNLDEAKSQRIVIPKNSITKEVNSNMRIFKTSTETPKLNTQDDSIFVRNLFKAENGIKAQLQDKIVGTVIHPTNENKFVTYKKDQSYYLYSNHNDDNFAFNGQIGKENQNNNYPDLITFHFVPSENERLGEKGVSQNTSQNYQETERIPKENKDTSNSNIEDDNYTTNIAYKVIHPATAKQREPINTLYDGPSSYSAPQSLIGNLISAQGRQSNNYNSRIEDLDENNHFVGYPKERPSRQFTFK